MRENALNEEYILSGLKLLELFNLFFLWFDRQTHIRKLSKRGIIFYAVRVKPLTNSGIVFVIFLNKKFKVISSSEFSGSYF